VARELEAGRPADPALILTPKYVERGWNMGD
jgi:hypothetical protein